MADDDISEAELVASLRARMAEERAAFSTARLEDLRAQLARTAGTETEAASKLALARMLVYSSNRKLIAEGLGILESLGQCAWARRGRQTASARTESSASRPHGSPFSPAHALACLQPSVGRRSCCCAASATTSAATWVSLGS